MFSGYTGISLSVCGSVYPCICMSVCPSVYKILVSVKVLAGGIKSHLVTALLSVAVFRENPRYCYSLGIIVVVIVVAQKLTLCNISLFCY